MILRGVTSGHDVNFVRFVFCSAGIRNFFATYDRYWYTRLGLADWQGAIFQSKTSTQAARRGNMPIDPRTLRPKEWKPDCVRVYPSPDKLVTMNAVGLSGPGFPDLLSRGQWQPRTWPFVISVAAESKTSSGIATELGELSQGLLKAKPGFHAPFAVTLNVTCAHIGHDRANMVVEALAGLEALQVLRVPVVLNLNALVAPATAAELIKHPACAALSLTNTIPFGQRPDRIDWVGLFGSMTSPLSHLGGGSLSGPPLLLLVEEWLKDFRANHNETFPIIAGGGVFSVADALRLCRAGASAIFLGTVAMYRPWRVQPIIKAVNAYFEERR